MRKTHVSQDRIVSSLKGKIELVLSRPGMYAQNVDELRGLLSGLVDALAIACSGNTGGFLHGEIPSVNPTKTRAENEAAITAAVRRILEDVPAGG